MKKIDNQISVVPTQIKNPNLVRTKRRQIVDATVSLFVKHGYHKTTTRMIAKAANFSIGSLYEYVGSKEDVLYLVCEAIHGEVEKSVKDALSGTGKEILSDIIKEYFFVCHKMTDHVLLIYQVTKFLSEKLRKKVLENELRITNIFIKALNHLSKRHDFPFLNKKKIFLLSHNISVLGHMWAFRRWSIAREFTIKEYIEYQTDFIMGLAFKEINNKS
ncbi:MAG: TetR family transcriptional regulator [Desulfobacteraceae bacterium 4572_130]|nr:MAG: TetR family transcriptional regulator [Desulfobacteraceae bacterium 4572_130]